MYVWTYRLANKLVLIVMDIPCAKILFGLSIGGVYAGNNVI